MKLQYIGTGVYEIDFKGTSYRFEANEVKTLADDLLDEVLAKLNTVDGSLWEVITEDTAHTHTNKTILDAVTESFTTALKTTYDNYATGKEEVGVAAGLLTGHTTTYNHATYDGYAAGKENTGVAASLLGTHVTNKHNFTHQVMFAGTFTTVGGAATEVFSVVGALATDIVSVMMHTEGVAPVTILTAFTGVDQFSVKFSADPSNDHVFTYVIHRAV